ncbi:hypothetical protein HanPSC8_Chr05g0213041 [Helianthus annuus]|nr:hypothetical protein HanPSC8_Chr05g0213041 [Helianthus annuus]
MKFSSYLLNLQIFLIIRRLMKRCWGTRMMKSVFTDAIKDATGRPRPDILDLLS